MTTYHDLRSRLEGERHTWLITGVAGFIGSHLLETLLKLNQRVVGLDNLSLGTLDNIRQVEQAAGPNWKNFRFIKGDIRSLDTCHEACRSTEFVLHQAALGSVPRSIEDPLSSHASNVTGFLNMLVAARDAKVSRFVYASSSAVYGDQAELPKFEERIGNALSPYGATKVIDETYAGVFSRCYGMQSAGLRYFNVFGPRQATDGAYAAVIPRWIAAMIRGEPVCINGDGEIARDFCYVDNAVQANLLAATAPLEAASATVFNVALNGKTTLKELFAILRELLRPDFARVAALEPVFREARVGDVQLSQADIGRARRLLGYEPTQNVREGLALTIAWFGARLAPQRPRAAVAGATAGSA
jgi:UDP-N-acetylglucosamine 4-epimerase